MFEYTGAIHMHSIYSDGTGTIEEIAKSANETNLDYIIVTDHNTLKAKELGYERWFDNTMVIIGYEVNDIENKNHYLVLGLNEVVGTFTRLSDGDLGNKLSVYEYVKLIKEKGGIGFIAHPHESRSHLPEHPPYPWTAWDCNDIMGMEIWNHMSEWTEGLTEENKIQRFLHPLKSIVAPLEKTLKKWDELNLQAKIPGIGGVDAHAFKQNILGFFEVEIFSYKVMFKSIRTHVFLEEKIEIGNPKKFEFDKLQIINALKEGKSFFVNSYHGDGKGFRFCIDYAGVTYNVGTNIHYNKDKNKKFIIRTMLPSKALIKLIHNGKCVDKLEGIDAIWDSDEPGIYRIECWKDNKGWIFSNHIRIL